jgi:hypothetical protein
MMDDGWNLDGLGWRQTGISGRGLARNLQQVAPLPFEDNAAQYALDVGPGIEVDAVGQAFDSRRAGMAMYDDLAEILAPEQEFRPYPDHVERQLLIEQAVRVDPCVNEKIVVGAMGERQGGEEQAVMGGHGREQGLANRFGNGRIADIELGDI